MVILVVVRFTLLLVDNCSWTTHSVLIVFIRSIVYVFVFIGLIVPSLITIEPHDASYLVLSISVISIIVNAVVTTFPIDAVIVVAIIAIVDYPCFIYSVEVPPLPSLLLCFSYCCGYVQLNATP